MDSKIIEEIWADQKSTLEGGSGDGYTLERRMTLKNSGSSPIFVATRYSDHQQGFTITVDSKINKRTIPDEGQHFSIETDVMDDGSRRYWWGLKNKDYYDQFLTMGVRVSTKAASSNNEEEALDIFLKEITKWIAFLKDYDRFPTRNYIVGLFGELSFMKNIIDRTNNYEIALNAWKNGNPVKDFYFKQSVFEVKTSTANPISTINIGSWNQLNEETVSNNLFLSTIALHDSDPKGQYIFELVDEMVHMFKDNADHLSERLREKLENENYYMATNKMYERKSKKYSVNEIKFFRVSDNFPRIKHFDIESFDRPGIDSITYKIDYSHLINFEVDFEEFEEFN